MAHHGAALRALRVPAEVVDRLADDWRRAPLDAVDRALCAWAERLGERPCTTTASDVEPLRAAGLGDRAIHDATCIVAYFHFVNRIACGLGVELEPGCEDGGGGH